jgi:hypothetical protein
MFLVGTDQMEAGKYISEHDKKIANKQHMWWLVVIYLKLLWSLNGIY